MGRGAKPAAAADCELVVEMLFLLCSCALQMLRKVLSHSDENVEASVNVYIQFSLCRIILFNPILIRVSSVWSSADVAQGTLSFRREV